MNDKKNTVRISIIIVTYNNISDIEKCLLSIKKYSTHNNYEVIIVDNSTDDELYDYVNKKFSDVQIIKSENKGFGTGNNIGASRAKGDILFFLNPDTEFISDILPMIITNFDVDNRMSMCGFKLISREGKSNFSYHYRDKYGVISNQLIKAANIFNYFNSKKMFIMGADIAIRKSVFFQIGMFDENIFMYNEEADLTRRIFMNHDFDSIKYFKNIKIIHNEGKNTNKTWVKYKKMLEISNVSEKYYCEKYGVSYEKRINKRTNYEKIKYVIYVILFKKKKAIFQKEVVNYFESLKKENIK